MPPTTAPRGPASTGALWHPRSVQAGCWPPGAVTLPHAEGPAVSHQPRPIGSARCCRACPGPCTWHSHPVHGERPASPTRHSNTSCHLLSPPISSPCEDTDCPQLFLAKPASRSREPLSGGGPQPPSADAGEGLGAALGMHSQRVRARPWDGTRAGLLPAGDPQGRLLGLLPGVLRTWRRPCSPHPMSRVPCPVSHRSLVSSRGQQRSPEGVPSGSLAITGSHLPQT